MQKTTVTTDDHVLADKVQVLVAIGAATAANCIPCFEHLYEKALTSGVTTAEIKGAADIAGMVKKGAHQALSNSVADLVGTEAAPAAAGCAADGQPCTCI